MSRGRLFIFNLLANPTQHGRGDGLRDVLRVDRQHPDDARFTANKVDHAHTSALAASAHSSAELSDASGAGDDISEFRVLHQRFLE